MGLDLDIQAGTEQFHAGNEGGGILGWCEQNICPGNGIPDFKFEASKLADLLEKINKVLDEPWNVHTILPPSKNWYAKNYDFNGVHWQYTIYKNNLKKVIEECSLNNINPTYYVWY